MGDLPSLEMSDAFWERAAPLVPVPERDPARNYKRKPGGGRKPMPLRQIFKAIMYVL